VPFECLGDPERTGYAAAGLERGERKEYIGLNVYRKWFRAAKVGAYVGRPSGDIAQRPGTFVVDRGGEVLLAHYNRSSPDNPAMEDLVEALKRPTLRPRG
jgi:alkyl-hydroperoxide reductase/thiol specific antioxidant family protein